MDSGVPVQSPPSRRGQEKMDYMIRINTHNGPGQNTEQFLQVCGLKNWESICKPEDCFNVVCGYLSFSFCSWLTWQQSIKAQLPVM